MKSFKQLIFKLYAVAGALTYISLPVCAAQDMKEIIDIEFSDGKKAIYNGNGLSFPGPSCISADFSMTPNEIRYGNAYINRTLPLSQLIGQLQNTSGVRSAILRTVPLSFDEKYQREVGIFNNAQTVEQPLQQQVDLIRNFYALTLQYQNEGSKLAGQNIPIIQSILGINLANLSASQEEYAQRVPSLREAVNLLDESARSGTQTAIQNAPQANFLLAVALINSTNEEESMERSISLLREGINFMGKAKKMGRAGVEKQFALANYMLAEHLYLTVFPDQLPKKLLNPNDVLTLREAYGLLTLAKKDHPSAVDLFMHIQGILDQVTPSVLPASSSQGLSQKLASLSLTSKTSEEEKKETVVSSSQLSLEIPQELTKTIEDSSNGKAPFWFLPNLVKDNEVYRQEKYLPVYLQLLANPKVCDLTKMGLLQNYPHPKLICSYLLAERVGISSYKEIVEKLVTNKEFMNTQGLSFFLQLITTKKSSLIEARYIFKYLTEEKIFTIDEMIYLAFESMKDEEIKFFSQNDIISYVEKMPGYEPNVHGIKIADFLKSKNN
ncbi:hypothetical protein [Candidatus Paracaedibacter symbiosus]|uniref:hypothetical protein n=1 Tax=Candidatus Paracaedibacter symbiosus TaxID=244582 RepID=UPI00050939A6|nr:hypothetical protein [Candidatus Paracaedibacter symbiosus]